MDEKYSAEYRAHYPSYPNSPIQDSEIEPLLKTYSENRVFWSGHGEEYGLSPNWFDTNDLIIGPFVHPTPTPTVFAGNYAYYQRYKDVVGGLADSAVKNGYAPKIYDQVILGSKQFQDRGPTASDNLVILANVKDKVGLKFAAAGQRDMPYRMVEFDTDKIKFACETIDQKLPVYTDAMGVKAKHKRPVAETIISDLEMAEQGSPDGKLITFIEQYNAQVARRFNNGSNVAGLYEIDFNIYSRFLKEGVVDPELFLKSLAKIGYFQEASRLFIAYDPNTGKQVEVHGQTDMDNATLYDASSRTNLKWEDVQRFPHLLPFKELAYLMNMSSMVSTLYAGRNDDHLEVGKETYYHSYAWTKFMVEKGLGLQSVFHRIQPQISDTYTNKDYPVNTVYHFYDEAMNPGNFKKAQNAKNT